MPTDSRTVNSRGSGPSSEWVRQNRGDFRWQIRPGFEDWIEPSGELQLSDWLSEGRAEVVKTGPHRSVYRLNLSSGIFYLKHYRTADWQAVLQNLVRPSRADLEWRAARLVARSGIPTFETIAVGRRRSRGLVRDSFLISREIPGSEPLDEFVLETFPSLDPGDQQSARRQIARRLGEISAKLHLAGLLHRDLHPGNVLIPTPSPRCSLFLIDLHALSPKRLLSLKAIAGNLALLNNFFARLSSPSDRMRFLKAYAEVWNGGEHSSFIFDRHAVRRVEEICRAALAKADRRGDQKWERGNRRLVILDQASNHCRGLAELGRDRLEMFQAHPEQLLAQPIAWQKHEPIGRRAVVEIAVDGRPVRVIVQTFFLPRLARTAWDMGHALLRRRLPAVRPLLFVETPSQEDYLVLEEIPGACSLAACLKDDPDEGWWNDLLSVAAAQLRKLHQQGFYQPSLSVRSLLVREEGAEVSVWFSSLEHLRKHSRIETRQVAESFGHCLANWPRDRSPRSSQWLRFLRSYLGPRFSAEWKTYWRSIAVRARRLSNREAA